MCIVRAVSPLQYDERSTSKNDFYHSQSLNFKYMYVEISIL